MRSVRRLVAAAAGAIILSSAAGCTTASLQSAAPKTAGQTAVTATALQPATPAGAQPTQQTQAATAPATQTRRTTTVSRHRSSHTASSAGTRSAQESAKATTAQSGKRQSKGTATKNAPFVEEGAAQSKTYPKFVPPKAATTQMTDKEKKAFQEQMAARMKANAPTKSESPAQYAERLKLMRALAAQHGEDTLKAIEK